MGIFIFAGEWKSIDLTKPTAFYRLIYP